MKRATVKVAFASACLCLLAVIGTYKSFNGKLANFPGPGIHAQTSSLTLGGRQLLSLDNDVSLSEENVDCKHYHDILNITNEEICIFVNVTESCQIDEGFINYIVIIYCQLTTLVPLGIVLFFIWWLFLFIGLATTADDFFCPALEVISKTLKLSHNIAGVTFLAFGNGAPDIFSAIAAIGSAKGNDAGLAVGALFGAGIFVTTIVVGAISITSPFTSMERPFMRDIVFYLGAVFWTFYVLYDGKIHTGEAIGFICLYIGYVLVVIIGRIIRQRHLIAEKIDAEIPETTTITVDVEQTEDSDSQSVEQNPSNGNPAGNSQKMSHLTHSPLSHAIAPNQLTALGGRPNTPNRLAAPVGRTDSPSLLAVPQSHTMSINQLSAPSSRAASPIPERSIKELAHFAENLSVSAVLAHDFETHPALQPQVGESLREVEDEYGTSCITDDENTPLLGTPGDSGSADKSSRCDMFTEFMWSICPVDVEGWANMSVMGKIYEIFKAPVQFCLIITIPVVDYREDKHKWSKLLNCLQIITGPTFSMAAIQKAGIMINGQFPVIGLVLIVCFVLAVVAFCTSKPETRPVYHWAFAYLGFVVSVIWIYTIANEIVNILQMFGVIFSISDGILGLTLLAWGNSIGDLISDTVMAKQGFPRMGVSACFGGPLFNLLLGIGIPFSIACVERGGEYKLKFTLLQGVLAFFLAFSLVSSLVILPLRKFRMDKKYGIYLGILYLTFIVFAVLVETDVLIIPGIDNH